MKYITSSAHYHLICSKKNYHILMLRLTVVGFLRPKTEILARSPDRSFGNGLFFGNHVFRVFCHSSCQWFWNKNILHVLAVWSFVTKMTTRRECCVLDSSCNTPRPLGKGNLLWQVEATLSVGRKILQLCHSNPYFNIRPKNMATISQ